MKNRAVLLAASVLFLAVPAFAQRPEDRRPNEQRGEENTMSTDRMRLAPIKGASPIPPAPRITLRPSLAGPQGRRARQHLAACEQWSFWYGHDKPNDKRFQVDHPFEHGHLEHLGPSYRYKVERFDANRHIFWFPGGFSFQIASWDWPVAADWCWNCDSDDSVVYQDPDHDGWYLLYNIHTGGYVYVMYMGT